MLKPVRGPARKPDRGVDAYWFSQTSARSAPRLWLGDIFQPITVLWLSTMRCHHNKRLLIGLLEQTLFQRADQRLALLHVALAQLLLVELIDLGVIRPRQVERVLVGGQELGERERGIIVEQIGEVDGYHVVAGSQRRQIRRGVGLNMFDLDTDLPPLVDQEDAGRCIGHGEVPVPEHELQVRHACFGEQLPRFRPRLR